MANVLEFALGLQTSEFLSKLGFAGGELLSFAGVAELLEKAWDKTWDAIDKGADLQALAAATGESVGMLAQFEHGLDAIGAQFSPMMFLQVQKALSGVNEQGQRTDLLFGQMGLNINKLRGQDTVKSIQDIAVALNKLNPTQGAGVAEQIFGRYGAESVLKMARNAETFSRAMSGSSNTGALLDKFSKTFEDVMGDWDLIKGDVEGIWVSVAGALGPEMHKIFSEVHTDIADIGPALTGAIESGHIREFLSDSMAAAFEQGQFLAERTFSVLALGFGESLYVAMVTAFENVLPMFLKLGQNIDQIEKTEMAIGLLNMKRIGDMNNNNIAEAAKDVGMIQAAHEFIRGQLMLTGKDFGEQFAESLKTAIAGGGWIAGDMAKAWAASGANAPHISILHLLSSLSDGRWRCHPLRTVARHCQPFDAQKTTLGLCASVAKIRGNRVKTDQNRLKKLMPLRALRETYSGFRILTSGFFPPSALALTQCLL